MLLLYPQAISLSLGALEREKAEGFIRSKKVDGLTFVRRLRSPSPCPRAPLHFL